MAIATSVPPPDKKGPAALAKAPSPPTNPLLRETEDSDFLPAALEILQTPPPPIIITLMLSICGAFVLALIYAYLSWLDINVIASGKIQYSGLSKVLQPLEPGKVVAVFVENGQHVNAGDALVQLDSTETSANLEAKTRDFASASGEASRREVAIAVAQGGSLRPQPIKFEPGVDEFIREREVNVLAADLGKLESNVASLQAQLREKLATKERVTLSIAARDKLIALSKERAGMRQSLSDSGTGSREAVLDVMLEYEEQLTAQTGDQGRLLEADKASLSLQNKIEETISEFVADQTQKLADAQKKKGQLEQELIKAKSKNDQTRLTAPIGGTVQQLNVTTIGQVVSSGQALMTIVPTTGPVEIEVMVDSQDIGFIERGQRAVAKIEAFPFTRYGTISGTITNVSRDAVDKWEASNLSDAENAAKPRTPSGSQTPREQYLAFPATITLTHQFITINGEAVNLKPGMAVTAEIKTGQRRIFDYLFSPLQSGALPRDQKG